MKFPHLVFSSPNWSKRIFSDILCSKNLFLPDKKNNNWKLKNWHFLSRGQSVILVKNLKFLYLKFFLANWSKRVFGNVLNRKWASRLKKNIILESCKICIFKKVVSSCFWSRIWSFLTLFLMVQIVQKESLETFLKQKTFSRLQISWYLEVTKFAFFASFWSKL